MANFHPVLQLMEDHVTDTSLRQTMPFFRTLILTVSLLVLLVSEGISHRHPATKLQQRNLRSFSPFFRDYEDRDCTEDMCGRPAKYPQMQIFPEDEQKEYWDDPYSENDLVKRTMATGYESLMALAASAPVSWASFPNAANPYKPNVRSVFETKSPNCSCKAKEKPKVDMGSLHYPRYLDDFACDINSCLPNFYCKEIKYKAWILKQKQEGDIEDRHAPLLPQMLRENFMFKPKHLAAGCECFPICNLI